VGNNISISMLRLRKELSLIELYTPSKLTVISFARNRPFGLVDGLSKPAGRRNSPTMHGISFSIFTVENAYRTPSKLTVNSRKTKRNF
jgi:hypothetical protein